MTIPKVPDNLSAPDSLAKLSGTRPARRKGQAGQADPGGSDRVNVSRFGELVARTADDLLKDSQVRSDRLDRFKGALDEQADFPDHVVDEVLRRMAAN